MHPAYWFDHNYLNFSMGSKLKPLQAEHKSWYTYKYTMPLAFSTCNYSLLGYVLLQSSEKISNLFMISPRWTGVSSVTILCYVCVICNNDIVCY